MDFHLHGLAVAFAAFREPRGERLCQTVRLDSKTSFKLALPRREGVIELSRAREIAHGETIEPFKRAGTVFAVDDDFNFQFAGVHPSRSIASVSVRSGSQLLFDLRRIIIRRSLAFAARVP